MEPVRGNDPNPTLWRHRNFLLLWGVQTVSEMGSSVTQLALPLTAVVVLRASTFQVGLLTSAATLAFALIALPAGAIVDRRTKRWLMIWCDVARMLIIGSVPLAAALGALTLAQLYAVAVAAGVLTAIAVLLIPAMLVRDDLKQYTADACLSLLVLLLTSQLERDWSRGRLAGLSVAVWVG